MDKGGDSASDEGFHTGKWECRVLERRKGECGGLVAAKVIGHSSALTVLLAELT